MPSRNGRKYVARVVDLGQKELDCHSWGHAWNLQSTMERFDVELQKPVKVNVVECLRCPMQRTDVLDSRTHVKVRRSHYTEPDRYRVLEKTPRGRSVYQREALARARASQRANNRANKHVVSGLTR